MSMMRRGMEKESSVPRQLISIWERMSWESVRVRVDVPRYGVSAVVRPNRPTALYLHAHGIR